MYKEVIILFAFCFTILCTISSDAQDTIEVEPGVGTLNSAVTTYGGGNVYLLEAGSYYQINSTLTHSGSHLQIIGTEPGPGEKPATLQTGNDGFEPFHEMFNVQSDLTLKNIYFMNTDPVFGTAHTFVVCGSAEKKVIVDHCIIDPVGTFSGFSITGEYNDLVFTNNLVIRHGHEKGANDGHLFDFDNTDYYTVINTCLIQNNTFVSTGMNLMNRNFDKMIHNYIMWDHNTFIHHKSQLDWCKIESEFYFTNNLMFDFMTSAWSYSWQPMPGGDILYPKPALIYADTIPPELSPEVLPAWRKQFIAYNNMYHSKGFYDLVAELNASALDSGRSKVNLQPLIWTGDTPTEFGTDPEVAEAESRESQLFNRPGHINPDFPNWKYLQNTFDINPLFTDPAIYSQSDSLVEWQRPATYIHILGWFPENFPNSENWAKWHWDPDGDLAVNDAWPVFDGSYSNPELLTASIEGLPLGDLNWFPDALAIWEQGKEEVMDHIHSLNEGKLDLVSLYNPGNDSVMHSFDMVTVEESEVFQLDLTVVERRWHPKSVKFPVECRQWQYVRCILFKPQSKVYTNKHNKCRFLHT